MTIKTDVVVLNEQRNVTLSIMVQSVGGEFDKIENRPAVIILPGGAYVGCADHEAEVVAYPYLKAGYQAFVLRYSVGKHKTWPNPMNDYEQAMELIRGKADEWHVLADKIAVIGFSAGGHLAGCAATASKNRPNAAILGYAALGHGLTQLMHPESKAIVPTECVDGDTCPCFLFSTRDDSTVSVINTVEFELELIKNSIQYESHIYAFGNHGFSTGEENLTDFKFCSRVPHWVNDSVEWLNDIFGKLTSSGMTEPNCDGKINGNGEAMLSVNCTIEHLRKQSSAVAEKLSGIYSAILQIYPSAFDEGSLISTIVRNLKLKEVMPMFGMEETAIDEMDRELRQIANKKA